MHQSLNGDTNMPSKTATNRTTLLCLVSGAVLVSSAHAGLIDGRTQVGAWDFRNGNANDLVGSNNGQTVGDVHLGNYRGQTGASFAHGRASDYISFANQDAYQLTDGAIAIGFKQTGKWNSMETLFSKDASGYVDGGHLTINLLKGQNSNEGIVQVRLQSTNESYYVNSGTLDLNKWYNLEFAFGSDGMKLEIDGVVVDTNAYTGGLIGNNEDFSLGTSRWAAHSGEWNHLRNGYSGLISNVEIYGAAAVPAPGPLALLAAGGILSIRRKR